MYIKFLDQQSSWHCSSFIIIQNKKKQNKTKNKKKQTQDQERAKILSAYFSVLNSNGRDMAGLKLLTKGTNLMCINFKFFTSPDFWIAHHFIHRTMNIHYISYHHSILKHLMYQKRTWKRFDRWALLITIWGVTSCESSTWKWDFSKWCDILTKGNGDSGWKPTNAFKCVCRREWKWLHDCTK